MAVGSYELTEDPTLPKTGVFRGVLATYWYTDGKRRLHYDDIEGYSDGFTNNQFVGTWTSYSTKKTLRCNWGDFRIPNAGNFDMGAGEFSPDPKYYANGWQYYAAIYGNNDAARAPAEKQERQAWWK